MINEMVLHHVFYGENENKHRRSYVFYDHVSKDWVIMLLSEGKEGNKHNILRRISGVRTSPGGAWRNDTLPGGGYKHASCRRASQLANA